MRRLLFMLFALALTGSAIAQYQPPTRRLDSLRKALPRAQHPGARFAIYTGLSEAAISAQPDSAVAFAQEAMDIAGTLHGPDTLALAFFTLGTAYLYTDQMLPASHALFSAAERYSALGNRRQLAFTQINLGRVFFFITEYDRATAFLQAARAYAEQARDDRVKVGVYGGLARVDSETGQLERSIRYGREAVRLAAKVQDITSMVTYLLNNSAAYISMSRYHDALESSLEAETLARQYGLPMEEVYAISNTGIALRKLAMDPVWHSGPNTQPTRIATLDRCIVRLTEAVDKLNALGMRQALPALIGELSDAYAFRGDYRKAYELNLEGDALDETLDSLHDKTEVSRADSRRELDLKEKDIQITRVSLAKRRNEQWLLAAGLALMLGVAALQFRNARRQQRTNALLASEQQRSEDLLHNILPADVAAELKQRGKASPHHYDAVSVLFTDFVGFTHFAQERDADSIVALLNEYFTAFDAIMERHGLEKIKTIGDAYMAVSGLPNPELQHAQRTVQAALEIRDYVGMRLATRSDHMKAGGGTSQGNEYDHTVLSAPFQIRIGIHSGPVVAGIVGVKKFAYDIWGDTVNTAARMEQSGEAGRVNISQSTYELVKDAFQCTARGLVEAKHKGAVAMYFVEAGEGRPPM